MKKFLRTILVAALCAFFLWIGFRGWENRQELKFTDCLDETIFTINGQDYTVASLGFYVVYEEGQVETQARIYNPNNTRDYWNLHVDGVFVQANAKKTILEMAIHDAYFYENAMKLGLKLDAEEENRYRNALGDFWMDLLDEQVDHMPVTDEYIMDAMYRIALAEKYQQKLAKENQKSYASYNWDGYEYQQLIEQQDLQINEKLWERIAVGNITLQHGKPNYINGHNK